MIEQQWQATADVSLAYRALAAGVVYENTAAREYAAVVRNSGELGELFKLAGARLVVNHAAGHAYLRPVETDLPGKPLLKTHELGFLPSLVVVLLREQMLTEGVAEAADGVFITEAQLTEMLTPFFETTNDEKRIKKVVGEAITKAGELGLLSLVRKASQPTYRISPFIEELVDAAMLTKILEEYRSFAERRSGGRARLRLVGGRTIADEQADYDQEQALNRPAFEFDDEGDSDE